MGKGEGEKITTDTSVSNNRSNDSHDIDTIKHNNTSDTDSEKRDINTL